MSSVTSHRSVTRLLTRLLAVLIVAGGVALALDAPAQAACKPTGTTLAQQAKAVDTVFSGKVTKRAASGSTVTFTVAVDRVFKGQVDSAETQVETGATRKACGLPGLRQGGSYVFFGTAQADTVSVVRGGGTHVAGPTFLASVTDLLGEGRPATPPAPIEATFTKVGGPPASVKRVAAPGVALVLVGLLGLALSALRGRRRA